MSLSEAQPRQVVFLRTSRMLMPRSSMSGSGGLPKLQSVIKLGGREIGTKPAKLPVRLMQKELKFLFCGCVMRRDMQDQGGRAAIFRKASSWLTKHTPAMDSGLAWPAKIRLLRDHKA